MNFDITIASTTIANDVQVLGSIKDHPDSPTALAIVGSPTPSEIVVSATAATDTAVTTYSAYRSTDGVNWTQVTTGIAEATITSGYTFTGLTQGTLYYFSFESEKTGFPNSDKSSSFTSSTPLVTSPEALSLTNVQTTTIDIIGTLDANVETVTVFISTDGTNFSTHAAGIAKASFTSGYTVSGLSMNTTYYFRFTGFFNTGGSQASVSTDNVSATTLNNPYPLLQDTYIAQSAPTTNYGSNVDLLTTESNSTDRFIILEFDTSATSTTVTSATVEMILTQAPTSTATITAYFPSPVSPTWNENTITWANVGFTLSTVMGNAVVSSGSSIGTKFTWDVTALFNAYPANNKMTVMFRTNVTSATKFASKENVTYDEPFLNVVP